MDVLEFSSVDLCSKLKQIEIHRYNLLLNISNELFQTLVNVMKGHWPKAATAATTDKRMILENVSSSLKNGL